RRHRARMAKIRGREVSMIFQEPMSSLNPVLSVGYQIAEVLIYQRRKVICDRLLARREITDEDLELFKEAVTHPDAAQRERLLAGFQPKRSSGRDRPSSVSSCRSRSSVKS